MTYSKENEKLQLQLKNGTSMTDSLLDDINADAYPDSPSQNIKSNFTTYLLHNKKTAKYKAYTDLIG